LNCKPSTRACRDFSTTVSRIASRSSRC